MSKTMTNEIILSDDDRAAKYVTNLTGWVSRRGYFFGDSDMAEAAARWDGCTHKRCEGCGGLVEKHSYCRHCHEKHMAEKYAAMPRKKWNGETPLYSQETDAFFYDEDELRDYLEETDRTVDDLRLIICEPERWPCPDESYFLDDAPEGVDLPGEIKVLLEELETVISTLPPMAWEPGKVAAIVEMEE